MLLSNLSRRSSKLETLYCSTDDVSWTTKTDHARSKIKSETNHNLRLLNHDDRSGTMRYNSWFWRFAVGCFVVNYRFLHLYFDSELEQLSKIAPTAAAASAPIVVSPPPPPTFAPTAPIPTTINGSDRTNDPTILASAAATTSTLTSAPSITPFHFVASSAEQQEAINAYLLKVERSSAAPRQHCIRRHKNISVDPALTCLNHRTPTTTQDLLATTTEQQLLHYPADADAHFHEIHRRMAPWAQHAHHRFHEAAGYAGPWIENRWISHFEPKAFYNSNATDDSDHDNSDNNNSSSTRISCLSDHFGPYIPIFLPWVDHWVQHRRFRYPDGFLDTLLAVLRPNVPYITVSQNDEGLMGRRREFDHAALLPNLLVLSAGGYGHVPIPLFKQDEAVVSNGKPVGSRSIGISYVGSLTNAPKDMRLRLHEHLLLSLPSSSSTNTPTSSSSNTASSSSNSNSYNFTYEYYYGLDWRNVSADSRFSLAPRGYGRTSYHLMETLQMGLIPVHVYTDVPWVPYSDLFLREIGFVARMDGVYEDDIDGVLSRLKAMTVAEIELRERRIASLRKSHFSASGALSQIELFLRMGSSSSSSSGTSSVSDLRCQALPGSTRGA